MAPEFKRRPKPLTEKQERELASAERHADGVVEFLAGLRESAKKLRAALRPLDALVEIDDDAPQAGELVDPFARFGGLVSVTGIDRARDPIRIALAEIELAGAVMRARYPTGHGRKQREAVIVSCLLRDGWDPVDIAWSLIEWDLVDKPKWSPRSAADQKAYKDARDTAYKRARAQVDSVPLPDEHTLVRLQRRAEAQAEQLKQRRRRDDELHRRLADLLRR